MTASPRTTVAAACVAAVLTAAGCSQQMENGPRYRPLAESDFFNDGSSARPQVEGTVAYGAARSDHALFEGREGNAFVQDFPLAVTLEVMQRGRERFDIFCSPCHGRLGDGAGTIVERGFQSPPSYHIDRLRDAPVGYLFDIATNGIGAMHGYASRVPPHDRWAIVAYIRALQLSQHARLDDAPEADRQPLITSP